MTVHVIMYLHIEIYLHFDYNRQSPMQQRMTLLVLEERIHLNTFQVRRLLYQSQLNPKLLHIHAVPYRSPCYLSIFQAKALLITRFEFGQKHMLFHA